MTVAGNPRSLDQAVVLAEAHSPFLRAHSPPTPRSRRQRWRRTGLAAVLAEAERVSSRTIPTSGVALRRERQVVALAVALADLAGASFEDVTHALERFRRSCARSCDRRRRLPNVLTSRRLAFAAIALGKQGSRELNYSSDIDPILIFDPATLPHRDRARSRSKRRSALRGALSNCCRNADGRRLCVACRPAAATGIRGDAARGAGRSRHYAL